MGTQATTLQCDCGWPRRAVLNEWFPVTFEEATGEYQLVLDCGERGKGSAIIRYCPWCGGALPKSKRATLFTTPTEADKDDVRKKMETVKTVEQLYEILGEPSDCFESPWRNQYTYRDHWQSLDLVVFEYKQHIHYSYSGKFRDKYGQI